MNRSSRLNIGVVAFFYIYTRKEYPLTIRHIIGKEPDIVKVFFNLRKQADSK